MNERFLFVGDTFWGLDPGTADLLADLLLVEYPSHPLSFTIQSSPRNSLEALFTKCPRDIIGRQAGHTLFCVGWEDLHTQSPAEQVAEAYHRLVLEVRNNCHTQLTLATLPHLHLPESSILKQKILLLNQTIRKCATIERTAVLDLAAEFERYQLLQSARGEFVRNLFGDDGILGPLGQTLCARIFCEHFSMPGTRFLLS